MSNAPCICFLALNVADAGETGWNGPVCIGIGENVSVDSRGHTGVNSGDFLDPSYHPNHPGIDIYINPGSQWSNVGGSSSYPSYDFHGTQNWRDNIDTILSDANLSYEGSGTNTISLNWSRPVDGKVLSTTMRITVIGNSEDHTTESSSGTGGSGGGGTF